MVQCAFGGREWSLGVGLLSACSVSGWRQRGGESTFCIGHGEVFDAVKSPYNESQQAVKYVDTEARCGQDGRQKLGVEIEVKRKDKIKR